MIRRLLTSLAAAALLVGVGACSSGQDGEPTGSPEPTGATEEPTAEIPTSDLGAATQWLLDIINGDHTLTTDEAEERFAPSFLDAVGGGDGAVAAFGQAVALGPFRPVAYQESGDTAATRLTTDAGDFVLTIVLDADLLITGATVLVAPEIPEQAESWDALTERVDALTVPTSVTVFEVTDGAVGEPQYTAGTLTGPQPSGSMFKLFVLLAVVQAVEAGDLTWDTELTIDDSVRSLPSGVLQNEPDGAQVTVQDAAHGMISISDNTATDLLIAAVGRDAVEAMIAQHAPDGADATTPMLTTRALFEIGWGQDDLAPAWAAADDDERDRLLDEIAGSPLTTVPADVAIPVWDSGLDWFFSPADLARAHVALQQAAQTDAGAPVAEILTANPGLDMGAHWDTVAFKGGSSIGVMGGSWYLATDEASYVVVVHSATTDEQQAAEQTGVLYLAGDAAGLLAQE